MAVLTYSVPTKGSIAPATLAAAIAAVPAPEEVLEELGCYIASDVTSAGATCTRVITINDASISKARVLLNFLPGQSGSPVASVTVGLAGSGYVRAPTPELYVSSTTTLAEYMGTAGQGARFQAYLGLIASHATQVATGAGYSASTIAGLVGGMPLGTNRLTQARPGFGAVNPLLWTGTTGCGVRVSDPPAAGALNTLGCVRSIVVTEGGIGYSPATTTLLFLGGSLAPGGRPARGFPAFDGKGRFIGGTVVDPGLGYITAPTVALLDTGASPGRGALGTVNMVRGHSAALSVTVVAGAVTAVNITDPGDGYVSMPKLVIWDPTGGGSGASYTVGPIPGTVSLFGVSRVDVLARGSGYNPLADPVLVMDDFYTSLGLVAQETGQTALLKQTFSNLMKTAIQNLVGTAVVEALS
jgi:hypothetical protein